MANKYTRFILVALLLFITIQAAFGYSTTDISISRVLARTEAPVDESIEVTVHFINSDPGSMSGFYYTEHLSNELTLESLGVTINGIDIENCTFEINNSSSIYTDHTSYRWVLELPPGFLEDNSINENDDVQIIYTVKASQEGVYNLDGFSWVGYYAGGIEAAFGHSEDSDIETVTFTSGVGVGEESDTPSTSGGGGGCFIHSLNRLRR